MKQLERLFREQKGVCPWCCYTMILDWPNPHIDAIATIDHLAKKDSNKRIAKRFKVAAHRGCNNARAHDPEISQEAKEKMRKSAAHLGLTLNKTAANHTWSQKIRHAFQANGISIRSPFRKK